MREGMTMTGIARVSVSARRRGLCRIMAALCLLLVMSCAGGKAPGVRTDVSDAITHRVKAGDTWRSLAREYYGDERRAGTLAEFNGYAPGAASDPEAGPDAGSGIRVPMTAADRRTFDRLVEASRHYNEGLELASSGKYADATLKFEKALKTDPGFADAAFNLGVTSQKLGMHQKAIEIFRGMDLRGLARPEYYYALGASYFHLRRYPEAGDAFEKALALDPVHLKALYSLSVVYEKTGKDPKAADLLRTYIRIAPPGIWKEQAEDRLKELGR
ncbi:MAG TPA: tetratricopeptide repeat protein [Candidatus Krumholzibacterium sp.]|nr:tetratricopeptide repeat protein [Candidatus Krumholzibacterium sp.]